MRRNVMILTYSAIGLVIVFLSFAAWVRLAPSDPAFWHIDPANAPEPNRPNFARLLRVTSLTPSQAAAEIAAQAGLEGAERLAGDELHTTWIARSRLMRYPDYVSVRLTPEGAGTRIVAYSRARFGYGDGGVNAARLQRWIGRLPE